jgi:hypothetical protein
MGTYVPGELAASMCPEGEVADPSETGKDSGLYSFITAKWNLFIYTLCELGRDMEGRGGTWRDMEGRGGTWRGTDGRGGTWRPLVYMKHFWLLTLRPE